MQVPYNFQQVINNNQYQVINGVKCFPVSMLDENFSYLCKVVNVGSTAPTVSYDGQFWFDGTTLKIAQSSSWVDIKVANAVNADKLGGLLPSQFLRSDQNTTCSGNITAQQFVSTTTSTPPFIVSSNQLVTNLCADYLDGYHLDSTSAVTGQLVQFDTANVKLSAAPIYVVSGNVGVGITSPTQKLHIGGNIGIQAGANAFIGTLDNYILSLRTNNTDRVIIDTNGNVGIGTTPSYKLHVAGNIAIQVGANAFLGTVDNYALSLRTNNTDRIFVTSSGSVGIGTTAPAYNLDVVGDIRSISSGYVYIHPATSSSDSSIINLVGAASSTGSPAIRFGYGSYSNLGGLYMSMSDKSIRIGISKTSDGQNFRDAIIIPPANGSPVTCVIPDMNGSYETDWPSGWGGGISTWDICCDAIYYSKLTQRSDASIKTDVQPLSDYLNTDCLDVISCLKPVRYVYVNDPLKVNRFGFIAQDVSEVCPELIAIDTEGKASFNYMDLIALLTRGIQELYDMLGKVIQKIGGIS